MPANSQQGTYLGTTLAGFTAVTAGLVIAFFLALTISVQFWLATTPPAGGSGAVVMAYPTPDPHP